VVDLLNPGTVLQGHQGQYRIISVIGRGGQGAVYRGEWLKDGSIWAVKEMRPPPTADPQEIAENRRLFAEEAAMLRKLQHPNLPRILDDFEQGGRPYLVMEFVNGQTLEDRQEQINAPFAKNDVLGWGIQIAQVFHYLHTQRPPIIFRDMKPTNVMLTPEGIIKLIDFGVARTYKATKSKDTVAMGSPGYAPPEQYGKGQTDARSDIYALCATLLHLLTNLPPIPLQPPKPGYINKLNPTVDAATEQVIIKGMALKQDDRFQTAEQLAQAFAACIGRRGVETIKANQAPVQPPPQPAPPPLAQAAPQGRPCDNCGRVNSKGARFCSGCGQRLEEQFEAKLIITSPRGVWEFPLIHFPCRIGRRDPTQNHHPELDLADYDRGVASRRHAIIQRDGSKYIVIDLGSVNGTTVNNLPLTPHRPYVLRPGDRIRIGEVDMVFGQA
jgi:serine/threonine protein kinase